jgi:hypothetical protein
VEVESKETLETLSALPTDKLPEHVRIAVLINDQMLAHVSPLEPASPETRVNVTLGNSTIIRIKVGKKP